MTDTGLRNQTFLKEFAEARRVGHGETDIFVQVEKLDLLPVDARSCGQRFKHIELRCGAGSHHTSLTTFRDGETGWPTQPEK